MPSAPSKEGDVQACPCRSRCPASPGLGANVRAGGLSRLRELNLLPQPPDGRPLASTGPRALGSGEGAPTPLPTQAFSDVLIQTHAC